MSLIMSGDINCAIKKIEQYDKKFGKMQSNDLLLQILLSLLM